MLVPFPSTPVVEFTSLHLNGVEREREGRDLRVCLIIYIPYGDRAPSLSLTIPLITDHATATIILRSTKMSPDQTQSSYFTFESGRFKGQHWPSRDEDEKTATAMWLKSLPENAREEFETATKAPFTGMKPSEKPLSFPADFHTKKVSANFPYPFGKAGTAERITAYLQLRELWPHAARERASGDVQQRVAEWKRERESGTQNTQVADESDWEDVGPEEQDEGSTAQGTRQDTKDEEQRSVGSVGYQSSGPSRQDIEQDSEGWEGRLHPNPESPLEVPPHLRRYIGQFEYGL